MRQLDVTNIFLNGNLENDVYITQPDGVVDQLKPHFVYKLRKDLYEFKKAPKLGLQSLALAYSNRDSYVLNLTHLC